MTTHYLEFSIDQDRIAKKERKTKTAQIMSSLVTILHQIIYAKKEEGESMAVSFPQYSQKHCFLGHVIRLHGSKQALSSVFTPKSMAKLIKDHPDLMAWLIDAEYLSVSQVMAVPDQVAGYAVFSRRKVKNNLESIRRRRMKRHNETYEQACAAIPELNRHFPALPKVYLNSQSNKQLYPMLIERTVVDTPVMGEYNSFGLANDQATVPLF